MAEEVTEAAAEAGAVETQAGAEATGAPSDAGDYIAKVRSDPDFAEKIARDRDRQVSQLNDKLKKVEPLMQHLDTVGGAEGYLHATERWFKLQQNPQMAELVGSYLSTGQVPQQQAAGSAEVEEDEFFDPEVKQVNERAESRFEEMQGIIDDLQQRLVTAETRGYVGSVETNVQKALEWFPEGEYREMAATKLEELIGAATRQAPSDGRSRQFLEALSMEGGPSAMKKMLMDDVIDPNFDAIAAARGAVGAGRVAEHASPGRQTVSPAGGDLPKEDYTNLDPREVVRRALARATQKHGRTPESVFGGR